MTPSKQTIAEQLAMAVSQLQEQRTGYAPESVTVVLSEDTLVITLHGALTPAERALSKTLEGAAKVQDFHRQLFAASSKEINAEIKRITSVDVKEAATEVEPKIQATQHAFASGTMVQFFRLADKIPAQSWSSETFPVIP